MSNIELHNINMTSQEVLVTPEQLWEEQPMSEQVRATVMQSRQVIWDILDGADKRLFVVVGPCSIHDLSLIHISEPTRRATISRMPSSA